MANRRMFSKLITNSSEFMMMSPSAQNLYFHIGMNSDDDGFCEIFTVMRMTESKPDDLKSLHEKGFIYVVDSRVCIVKDWHENNYVQSDRYTQSKYLLDQGFKDVYFKIMGEKIVSLQRYNELDKKCIHDVSKTDTQVRLGKDRLGKDSIGNNNEDTPPLSPSEIVKDFMVKGQTYSDMLEIYSKNADKGWLEKEFKKFILYWTEPTPSGKKQRWQKQGTFEIKRRLYTWLNKSREFNQKEKTKPKIW